MRTTRRYLCLLASVPLLAGLLTVLPASGTPARSAASRPVVPPPVNARFDYQIGGVYRPASSVRIVDRDRTAHPAPGRYSICYVNAFQTQAAADRWWRQHHARLLLHDHGRLVEDPGWPGEIILDLSDRGRRQALARIVGRWIDGCARHRFAAVEPDNLDSYTRSHQLLSRRDALDYARLLVRRAHDDGLAIAQKNTAQLGDVGRDRVGFDFAIAEECQVYRECDRYLDAYGRHVIEVEYTDNGRAAFRHACQLRGDRISVILRDRDVVPRGRPGYVYRSC